MRLIPVSLLVAIAFYLFSVQPAVSQEESERERSSGERRSSERPSRGPETLDLLVCRGTTAKSYVACLETCNERDLLPGYRFRWKVVPHVGRENLADKHVVMYPGGTVKSEDTDIRALREFVAAGGGYYGTCAGAVAAIRNFELTPQVKGKGCEFQGCVDVRMTEQGTRVFGYGGNVILLCWNGLAFSDPGDVHAALGFWDNNHRGELSRFGDRFWNNRPNEKVYWRSELDLSKSGAKYMQSYADYFQKGRVVVVNAHPESGRGKAAYWLPRWVGAGVVWASGRDDAVEAYRLGFDQGIYDKGLYDNSREIFQSSVGHAMVCQREYVSEDGTISSLSLIAGGEAGKVIVGVYQGASSPERCVGQSAPTPTREELGWQTVDLTAPLRVEKGQTIWLAFLFQGEQPYYHKRFADLNGNAFENRVWASTYGWNDLRGGRLPDSPPGSIQNYLVCLFTDVRF